MNFYSVFTLTTSLILTLGEKCDEKVCNPNRGCICPSTRAPKQLHYNDVPQTVLVTFDDNVASNIRHFRRLFNPDRKNPNGCSILGTFFVSNAAGKDGEPTDYAKVKELYDRGHEIGVHSISHRFPVLWWSNASYQDYVSEMVGQKNMMVKEAGIPKEKIKGLRVPFLQNGGDNQFQMIADYDFAYDSSLVVSPTAYQDPVFPYTLHIPPEKTMCSITPGKCPTLSYPELWEVPLNPAFGYHGQRCSMIDECSNGIANANDTFHYILQNFKRHYERNRAPFGVYIHASWFLGETAYTLDGLDRFISYVVGLEDVWLITMSQALEWMKNPTRIADIKNFEPWKTPCYTQKKTEQGTKPAANVTGRLMISERQLLLLLIAFYILNNFNI